MGKVLDKFDEYPGWINQSKRCRACGYRWVETFHLWMKEEFKTWCPNCPKNGATLDNVIPIRRKVMSLAEKLLGKIDVAEMVANAIAAKEEDILKELHVQLEAMDLPIPDDLEIPLDNLVEAVAKSALEGAIVILKSVQ